MQNGNDLDAISPVDRTKADTDYNRSLMQRIAHLIHDANGVQFCNKQGATALGFTFNKCEMFEIDDLALFYILNMQTNAGNASGSAKSGADFCGHLTTTNVLFTGGCSTLIGSLVGIDGFGQFPTPAALNRSLFLPRQREVVVPRRHHRRRHLRRRRQVHRRARQVGVRLGGEDGERTVGQSPTRPSTRRSRRSSTRSPSTTSA